MVDRRWLLQPLTGLTKPDLLSLARAADTSRDWNAWRGRKADLKAIIECERARYWDENAQPPAPKTDLVMSPAGRVGYIVPRSIISAEEANDVLRGMPRPDPDLGIAGG